MNLTNLRKAIYDWVVLVLDDAGTQVYWGDQNAPRPPNPSVRLKFISGPNMLGLDELRDVDDPDKFAIVGPRTFLLSVTGQGDTGIDMIAKIQTSVSDPAFANKLGADGVSILSVGQSRDVTQLMETKLETRHQLDVSILITEYVETEPGVIHDVQAQGEILDQLDNVVETIDIDTVE